MKNKKVENVENCEEELMIINNRNYLDNLNLDIEAALLVYAGAQGAPGTFEFWTSDNKHYAGNFAWGGIDWDKLVKVVPAFSVAEEDGHVPCDEDGGHARPDGWECRDVIGPGHHLFIKNGCSAKYFEK